MSPILFHKMGNLSVIILRYLGREIYKTLLYTVSILLLILITNQLVNLLNRAAMGKIPALTVVQAVMLGIPQYLTYMVPLGLFLGIIVVLGKMSTTHELIAMHASGYSKGQLLKSILLISLPVCLFVASLTFVISPMSINLRKAVIMRAVTRASLDKVIPDQFQSLGDPNSTFHSEGKSDDFLEDVLWVQSMKKSSSNQLPAPIWDATRAKWASQESLADGEYLVFHDGHRVLLQPGSRSSEEFWFKEYGVLTPVPTLSHTKLASAQPLSELRRGISNNIKYLAEWQWRFAIPISVLVFTLIAFPLSQVKPRQGKFMRVFPAVLIYAIYTNLLFYSRSALISGTLSPIVGMWWVPMVALLLLGGYVFLPTLGHNWMRRRHG